jgi:ABC-2 type transport system permease protein
MKNYLRLLWIYLRVGIMNEVQYRINFFVQIGQSLTALATGLIVLALLFTYTDSLNNWTQPELLVVMGVHILMGGIIKMFIQPNMVRLMDDIHQGTLDFMLTKPENAQLLVSIREVHFWQFVDIVTGLAVIGWGISMLNTPLTVWATAVFLFTLLLGVIILYSFWLLIASMAFWFIRINDIITIFQTMYQAGRWPVGIYPGWLRFILTFLVPVAFAVTIPSEAFTGRLSPGTLLLATGLTAAIFGVAHLIWRLGLRSYGGASA